VISLSNKPRVVPGGAGRAAHTSWSPDDLGRPAAPAAPQRDPAAEALAARERELSEAYSLGFEEGRHEGELGEAARLRSALEAARDALDVMRANEERWTGTIEENIAALAVAVARHIVDRELASDAEIVTRIVRRALGEFPVDQPVRIRVNPNDLAIIEAHGENDSAAVMGSSKRDAHWIGDPRIASGGCVVEGRDRIIDGRVDTALERAYRRIAYTDA
jgi:flagellar assembly protein FliH